jgi:predicted nucleic acid-binding protein
LRTALAMRERKAPYRWPDLSVPGEGLAPEIERLLSVGRVTGAKVHDARIAALCLSHGVSELWSADRDFSRFPDLKTRNPLVP